MKTKFLASTVLAVFGCQTASAVEVSWYRQPGSARSITGNASAWPWIIGTDNNVYKWNTDSKQFVNQNYAATRIAVTTRELLWLVDELGLREAQGAYGGIKAREVALGADNAVWLIGTDARTGGYGVYQKASGTFNFTLTPANFGAVRIAVDKTGNVWAVNDTGELHMYDLASKTWARGPSGGLGSTTKVRSIHTGSSSGAVWITTTQSIPGGYPIYQWNASTRVWESYGTYGAVDMTEAAGVPWIVQSDGKLYSKADPTMPTAPVSVTQTWPQPYPQLYEPFRAPAKGKLLCSTNGLSDDCDENTKADLVGKYDYNESLKCDDGFYDAIYGGSCWKCDPGYDGKGAYIRSTTAVDGDTACWRVPVESTGKATRVKAPALAWDCPSGSFWDGYSPNGCCGSCWTCPTELPRRTAAPVWESNACASPLNETKRATFLKYNGCPKPDAADMNLPGKRTPGKPFLDVAAGATQSSSAGVCFACPITDADGNFLITVRNANPLYDADANTGCTIQLKWTPAPFYEPGLAYMQGVKGLIWEQKLFDGTRITGYLYDVAEIKGLGDATPAAKEWVKQQWQDIVRSPYNNTQFRAYMFVLLKEALAKEKAERTYFERELIKSFSLYIQGRRTYLAEQALAMYDAWKLSDERFRANTGQNRSLNGLFYYGTVPLDFHGTLGGLMGLGAAGGGVAGSLVSINAYAKTIDAFVSGTVSGEAGKILPRTLQLRYLLTGLNILKSVAGLQVLGGASLIEAAGAILSSIAIDQFIAIETARPKLEAALSEAQEQVDLDVLAASDNGEDMMYVYWSKAMETTDQEDAQVIQVAAMAQTRAEQSGYEAPPRDSSLVPTPVTTATDTLSSGTSGGFLEQGNKLVSKNGKYEAVMQADGNFVIYAENHQFVWGTGTSGMGTGPYKLAMQSDGNLAIYGFNNGFVWHAGASGGTAPYKLIMQDDGNLCIYDSKNSFIWNSGSYRAP